MPVPDNYFTFTVIFSSSSSILYDEFHPLEDYLLIPNEGDYLSFVYVLGQNTNYPLNFMDDIVIGKGKVIRKNIIHSKDGKLTNVSLSVLLSVFRCFPSDTDKKYMDQFLEELSA